MKARLATLLVLAAAATACGNLAVGPASPRPNVMLAADKTPSALVLDPGVRNDFVIPSTGSVNEVPVRGWRNTLQAGFRNAWPAGHTHRKLEILSADLSFAPAAVSGQFGTAAVRAQIRYKARLETDSGQELGGIAGTVEAREANDSPSPQGMTANASEAVEAMYEQLAQKLLAKY